METEQVTPPQMDVEHGDGTMTINLPDGKKIVAEWKKTRGGFKHEASLFDRYGNILNKTKINYVNRTWETYRFQTVLTKLMEKTPELQTPDVKAFLARDLTNLAPFKRTASLMMLGEVFGADVKQKNEMKLEALRATLPQIEIPADWATLDEPAKAERLKTVEEMLREAENLK